jgi:tetratricopeptide (TPR) repeat protein
VEWAQATLLRALAFNAQKLRDFTEAAGLFGKLAEVQKERGFAAGEAGAYHQLGRIAQEQRDFAAAERWYRKSLEINEKTGNEPGAAGARSGNRFEKSFARSSAAAPSKFGGRSGAGSGPGRVMLKARIRSGSESSRKLLR